MSFDSTKNYSTNKIFAYKSYTRWNDKIVALEKTT